MSDHMVPAPRGKVSSTWYANGYQAALKDITDALQRGGTDEALEWVFNNSWYPQVRAIAKHARKDKS